MHPSLRVLAVTSLFALVALSLRPPYAAQLTQASVQRDRWGITLHTDRPFYAVGEEVQAVWRMSNLTPFDAFGFTLSSGGNGCNFRLTILDAQGQTVWQPGVIVNGQFFSPGCLFRQHEWDLFRGTRTETAGTLPLIFQNAGGIGVLGAPLPAGFYRVTVQVFFNGPLTDPESTNVGLNHTASVPIQIL